MARFGRCYWYSVVLALTVCMYYYVCIIRNRILPWPASSIPIHTAIHTSICIRSIHFHHWVQYQSILLFNGQKNELISLGTPKSDFSPLSTPFFWWRVIFSLSLQKQTPRRSLSVLYVCMVSQASHSIQSINHRQLRPCRWQLVCLTSSDNLMIPSHSGPFFFFLFSFIFFPFRQDSCPFYAKCRTTQKGQNWFIQNAPCNNTPAQ